MKFTHDAHPAELEDIPRDWLSIILTPSSTPTATTDTSSGGGGAAATNTPVLPKCSDGIDNDGDGRTDYQAPNAAGASRGDPECRSASDNNEAN